MIWWGQPLGANNNFFTYLYNSRIFEAANLEKKTVGCFEMIEFEMEGGGKH